MRKALKADNRGLTLVELLLGVAILAVIVVPLLHTFITGANTVKKSKVHSDATLAAQNIIEDINATDMSAYLYGIEAEDGIYIKEIEGIEDSGGTKFDAKVTVVPKSGKSASVPISNKMDAVFRMQDVDSNVLTEYNKNKNKIPGKKLTRSISIDVSNNGNGKYTAEVKFDYYAELKKNGPYTQTVSKTANINQRTSDKSKDAFAIYLFFTAFPSTDSDYTMGDVVINNDTDRSFNVFLVDVGNKTATIGRFDVDYNLIMNNPPTPPPGVDVMVNMPEVYYESKRLPVSLVETEEISYSYEIDVGIYKAGSDKADPENLLASMSATKLDYSDKNN